MFLLSRAHKPFKELGLFDVRPVFSALGTAVYIKGGFGILGACVFAPAPLAHLGIHVVGIGLFPLNTRRGYGCGECQGRMGGGGCCRRRGSGMGGGALLCKSWRGGGRVPVVIGAVVRPCWADAGGEMGVQSLSQTVRVKRCLGRELTDAAVQMVESGDTPSHSHPGLGLCDPAKTCVRIASSYRCAPPTSINSAIPSIVDSKNSLLHLRIHPTIEPLAELSQFGSDALGSAHNNNNMRKYKYPYLVYFYLPFCILLVFPIRILVVALVQINQPWHLQCRP